MFKSSLPSPLNSLHFTKLDFGHVPLSISNVKTSQTEHDGIKLDMNVEWEGKCDIDLDGDMIPALVSGLFQCCHLSYPKLKLTIARASKVSSYTDVCRSSSHH